MAEQEHRREREPITVDGDAEGDVDHTPTKPTSILRDSGAAPCMA